ncbi:hypothetical protein N8755_04990 [Alphaproteobacteria bacterium]|nr:hypothetical protein [Alphaproteobacteria bacterium]
MSSIRKVIKESIKPLGVRNYSGSNSGWDHDDLVTITREYRNFTVDYVYSNHSVITHRENKELSQKSFKRMMSCPEPISVIHPIMREWDQEISKRGLKFHDGDLLPRNTKHYTVLLHQRGNFNEKLSVSGYYEVLATNEFNLNHKSRTRLIYNLNGDLLTYQKLFGPQFDTNGRSPTPMCVLVRDKRKEVERLLSDLGNWDVNEQDYPDSNFDCLSNKQVIEITNLEKVCNVIVEEFKDADYRETSVNLKIGLSSNIRSVVEEIISKMGESNR